MCVSLNIRVKFFLLIRSLSYNVPYRCNHTWYKIGMKPSIKCNLIQLIWRIAFKDNQSMIYQYLIAAVITQSNITLYCPQHRSDWYTMIAYDHYYRYIIMMPHFQSSLFNSHNDHAPVLVIYKCLIFKGVAATEHGWEGTRIVAPAMAAKRHALIQCNKSLSHFPHVNSYDLYLFSD